MAIAPTEKGNQMSRYIDADALIADINKSIFDADDKEWYLTLLVNAQSIDLVWCKECKHNYATERNHGKMHPRCDFTDRRLKEDDFCSRGERSE